MTRYHRASLILLFLGTTYLLRAETSSSRDVRLSSKDAEGTRFTKDTVQNVTTVVGQTALLPCRVKNLRERTVSWMRKRDLHILTSMSFTYTSDARFAVQHPQDSEIWDLTIKYVQPRDAGVYECQVNTEPKIHLAVSLNILDVAAKIWGPQEVYVKKGSTISLTCTVNAQDVPPGNLTWYHAGSVIDFDGPRGGVSLETEKTKSGTTSKLLVTRALLKDSGNYTCFSNRAVPTSVTVHVLNGEHPAAMQHGSTGHPDSALTLIALLAILTTINLD
ncbi:hemicentin-2 [Cephus cinctus]|uniref:Hemicentin-2 n=1 Tax=Cephus cinctus TaxID=211228 RepID=A0AAJ7C7E6_CEPCN|nr:hemicentin-2 [Cephus cinctus]